MKKIILVCAAVFSAMIITGCTAHDAPMGTEQPPASTQEAIVLFDTATCKIVLEGTETMVYDLVSDETYSFTTTRHIRSSPLSLEEQQARCIARTSTSTDSMEIQIAGGLIIVHDLAGPQTYYIQH